MEASTMVPASPDDAELTDPFSVPQDAVLITSVEQRAMRYLLATEPAGLPATLEDDAVIGLFNLGLFDADAQAVIGMFLDVGWFTINDIVAVVAQVPTTHGAGRAGRRRAERGQ
jgi:hypothetical protein